MPDYSKKYADEHRAYIHFSGRGNTLSFLSFMEGFSISCNFPKSEHRVDLSNDGVTLYNTGMSYSYNFTLHIPFSSRRDAINGKAKVDKLLLMFAPDATERRTNITAPGVKVLLSNLICNGLGSTNVTYHGVPCIADNLNVEYNSDLGWFDNKGTFYSKLYTISFTLKVKTSMDEKYVCLGYKTDGRYNNIDVKYWPFHIQQDTGLVSFSNNDYENRYEKTHSAFVLFQHASAYNPRIVPFEDTKRQVSFTAFLENFSKEHSYEYATKNLGWEVYTPKQMKGVNYKLTLQVPANNRRQSSVNMAKVQSLLRILAPKANEQGAASRIKVKFSNLIDQEVYIESVDIKVDTDLGYYEQYGMFFIKNYTLDLNMISTSKDLLSTVERSEDDAAEAEEEEETSTTVIGGGEGDGEESYVTPPPR